MNEVNNKQQEAVEIRSISFNVLTPIGIRSLPTEEFDNFIKFIKEYGIRIENEDAGCTCVWEIGLLQVSLFCMLCDVYLKHVARGGGD